MKFSIIIPVYNSKQYIKKTVESILCQNYDNYEILIINDGSTDNSLEICEKLKLSNSKIKIFNQENKGVSAARNLGLDNASGEWVIFVDSDDKITNNFFSITNKVIEKNSDMIAINYKNEKYENFIYDILYNESVKGYVWNKIFKRSIIDECNIRFNNNLHMAEDLVFVIEYLLQCKKIEYINDNIYEYNKNSEGSITNKKFSEKQISILDSYDYIIKQFGSKLSIDIINRLKIKKINHGLSLYYRCTRYYKKNNKKNIKMKIRKSILDTNINYLKTEESLKKKILFLLLGGKNV